MLRRSSLHHCSHYAFPICSCCAAVVAAATQGCALADCSEKAVVAFFVQQALENTTNAYLAFAGNTSRTYTSRQDFVARGQLFSATLQQVAALNTGLQDFFLTVNEFADQTQAERNVVNGVKGLKKVRGEGAAAAYNQSSLLVGLTVMVVVR